MGGDWISSLRFSSAGDRDEFLFGAPLGNHPSTFACKTACYLVESMSGLWGAAMVVLLSAMVAVALLPGMYTPLVYLHVSFCLLIESLPLWVSTFIRDHLPLQVATFDLIWMVWRCMTSGRFCPLMDSLPLRVIGFVWDRLPLWAVPVNADSGGVIDSLSTRYEVAYSTPHTSAHTRVPRTFKILPTYSRHLSPIWSSSRPDLVESHEKYAVGGGLVRS